MKRIFTFFLLVLVATLCFSTTSCRRNKLNGEIDLSGITFEDSTFTYDGSEKAVKISGDLPNGVSVQYTNNKKTDAGTYTATARLYDENGKELKVMTATLTINKAVYNMSYVSLPDVTYTYNGSEYTPSIVGALPNGVTVSYDVSGNMKNVGTYYVTARFTGNPNYEDIPDMKATYTIAKATYDMSGVSFPDACFTYTGEVKEPKIEGTLPEGVSVRFVSDPEVIKELGEYTVTAIFSGDSENYNAIPDMTATYTISVIGHDTLGVSLPNRIFIYTGEVIEPVLSGTLPDGITSTISSDPSVIRDVGVYKITVKFYVDGEYGIIPDMKATYTVKQGTYDMSGVSLPSVTLTYSGKVVTPYIVGTLPEGVTCTITSNPSPILDPGTYTVTASFKGSDQYKDIPNMTATYIIEVPQYVDGSLNFELLNDGTYEVVGANGPVTDVVIPSAYLGKAVTSIRSSAFEGDSYIAYVFIADSVTNIGNKAFKDCANLNTVAMSKSVKVIGAEAFANTALTDVILPDSLESLGRSSFAGAPVQSMTLPFIGGSRITSNPFIGYLFGALSYSGNEAYVPETLTSVTISGSAGKVPAYAFYGVKSLISVTVKSGVISIGNSAFAECSLLADVYIPATVTEIAADANVFNSPFYNTSEKLMLVMEVTRADGFGQYWKNISDDGDALVVYGKSYEDYLMNKEEYRKLDPTVATLEGIFVNGAPIGSFAPDTFDYTVSIDINDGYPAITAVSTSSVSGMVITKPTAHNSGVATIVVTSADGMTVNTYTVTVNFTGTFDGESVNVVGKDGTTGTVTFVIDDGDRNTATFTTEMMDKYDELRFTYAILTNQLATLKTAYDSSTGKYYYVMSDGNYTYNVKQDAVDFWNNILTNYDTEVVSHTYSHLFWGNNDDGGVQKYVDSNGNVVTSGNLPVGSATAEIYASIQIIEDLLGIRAATHVVPGIGVATTDKVVNGVTYETYYTYYQALISEAIDSGAILALAGNTMGTSTSSMNKYVTKDTIKKLGVNGVSRLFVRPTDDKSMWKQFIANAAANDGWATFCIHKISEAETTGHYILEKDAEELFAYAASENIWVANYTEAFLYYTQWASARVSAVYDDDSIRVTLTDGEDNTVYDEELTVKVCVPANWAEVNVNGESLEVYTDSDGSSYVLVNILPDSGTVTISAGF